ncbi:MAG: hypothetical protein ACRC9L_05320 [Brevinema sp.]
MRSIHVILGALFLTSACALTDVGRLNPEFLMPLHDVLFSNEFQVNDPQFLFDASNQTVTVRSRTASDTVSGIYRLQLVANPSSDQAIYRMIGTQVYNNFFLGIQYSSRGSSGFAAKIVVQGSEVTARDALNSLASVPYVSSSTMSHAYYRISSVGTWARISSTGIYNASISDHLTFNYNELVDRGIEDQAHSLLYVNISGAVTNSSRYRLAFISNISSSAVIYYLSPEDVNFPGTLASRYIGIDISISSSGIPQAKIVSSSSSIIPDAANELDFARVFAATPTIEYTSLASVERPDVLLTPLRSKGPWVFVRGNIYDQLNTTNWDFSLQDQTVSVTAFGSGAGSTAGVPVDYSLQTTSVPSVFRLINQTGDGTLNNKFFTFKFRTPPGEMIERASFYIEDTVDAAASRLNGPSFTDNYVNIYSAALLGNGSTAIQYTLRLHEDIAGTLPAFVSYNNIVGISGPLFGATVFTRSEAGVEYIYVLGGSPSANAISPTDGMYEVIVSPGRLRNSLSRTASFGMATRNPIWEDITFSVSGSASIVAPFMGQAAWIGNRLFVYNPALYSTLPDPSAGDVHPNYRIISTSAFSGAWSTTSLPSELTNRPHGVFFSSKGILTLIGGLHYNVPDGASAGSYTITNDVWQSFNNGSTWAQVAKSTAFSPRYMATILTIGSEIYVLGGYTSDTPGGDFSDEIWRSSDDGLTWTKQGMLPSELVDSYDSRKYGRMQGVVINNTLYIVSANPGTSSTSAATIYSSRDGGKNWVEEDLIDASNISDAYDPTFSRASGVIGAGYVWSANNSSVKGVLFSIGGLDHSLANINPNANMRVLRRR